MATTTSAGAGADDLISVITDDHRVIEQIFAELETGRGTPQHRRDLADHMTTELVRHSVAEEMYMYPAARRWLPDGDRVADHEIAEHAQVEGILKDLEGVNPEDLRFEELVAMVISDVRHHVQGEEQQLLPRLQATCSTDELQELGRRITRAKETAPTRPHPSAPDTPPANMMLGPGAALVDRLRDAFTNRDQD